MHVMLLMTCKQQKQPAKGVINSFTSKPAARASTWQSIWPANIPTSTPTPLHWRAFIITEMFYWEFNSSSFRDETICFSRVVIYDSWDTIFASLRMLSQMNRSLFRHMIKHWCSKQTGVLSIQNFIISNWEWMLINGVCNSSYMRCISFHSLQLS